MQQETMRQGRARCGRLEQKLDALAVQLSQLPPR
jgi:hypothetical protein